MPTNLCSTSFFQPIIDWLCPQNDTRENEIALHPRTGVAPQNPPLTSPVPKRTLAGAQGHPAFAPKGRILASAQTGPGPEQGTGKASTSERAIVGESSDEAVFAYAETIRAKLLQCSHSMDFSEFGEVIKAQDGTPFLLKFHSSRVEEFRALLSLAREENSHGQGVLVGPAEKYKTCVLLASLDGKALGAVTQTKCLTSIAKAHPGSPKNGPRHRIRELITVAIDQFGANHLAALGKQNARRYGEQYCFEPRAIWTQDPSMTVPGWSDKAKQQFQDIYERNENGQEIGPPIVFMSLNKNEWKNRVPLAERSVRDYSDFSQCQVLTLAGKTQEEVWAEGYAIVANAAAAMAP